MTSGPEVAGPCTECGFDPQGLGPADIVGALLGYPRRYTAPLTRFLPGEDGAELIRRRPEPTTWSALEYAAHVADVFALFARRISVIRLEETPDLEVIDWDSVVDGGGYEHVEPGDVLQRLADSSAVLAAMLDAVEPDEWQRKGIRDGEVRTIHELAVRAVHEGAHHLLDIGRGLRAVRGR